ncbi:glycosyltransferase family 2 protein [Parabacteroides pacaensis]|uniref:glycosyltransferase family 2 protein n=1 Tax=Parabacteroides pacaensis TaxID=2086575 RepID=UPI000D0FFF75|nr:glycosyltransferase family 2 protein [Parabacteroides pacaensis]
MKISVIINTYNAEKHLAEVLESVKDFDEILICDMYSTDQTVSIAKRYNCHIIYHEKLGYVEPARQAAINAATYNWILLIDADEVVPPALKDYLYEQIKKPDCPNGIRIPRKNYLMGKFVRCTYPDYILRFFKKEGTVWPSQIHMQPQLQGKVINTPLHRKDLAFIHLSNDPVKIMVSKANAYTDYEIGKRKNKKYAFFSILIQSAYRFFKFYVIKGGFRDGRPGLVYSGVYAFYKFMTIAKLWEVQFSYKDLEKDLKNLHNK